MKAKPKTPAPPVVPAINWNVPQSVDKVTMVFPGSVVGKLLPPWDEIPKEFRDGWHSHSWCENAATWFYSGVDPQATEGEFAAHLTAEQQAHAWRHLQTCLGSWEPKHEHKIAGVGWLMSLWFKSLKIVGAKKD